MSQTQVATKKIENPIEKDKPAQAKKCLNCKWYQAGNCELTRVQRGGAPLHPKTKAWVSSVTPSVLATKPDFSCPQWEKSPLEVADVNP
jgi:hypothetical protein